MGTADAKMVKNNEVIDYAQRWDFLPEEVEMIVENILQTQKRGRAIYIITIRRLDPVQIILMGVNKNGQAGYALEMAYFLDPSELWKTLNPFDGQTKEVC